ncbi:hypothetical protein AGLY_017153, partial [Aphis glycines]
TRAVGPRGTYRPGEPRLTGPLLAGRHRGTPSLAGPPQSGLVLPVGRQRDTRRTRPMTTKVTVSQYTRQPEARTIPPRAAIVTAPGGRQGEAPGTTDFSSRPGFPHDLGWGPLRNGREQRFRRRSPDSRQRVPRRDGHALAAFKIHHEPRSVARRDPSGRGRATALGVGPPPGGPALGRTRTARARSLTAVGTTPAGGRAGPRAARACCKTEIPDRTQVTWITVVIVELIHADRVPTVAAPPGVACGRNAFIRIKTGPSRRLVRVPIAARAKTW